jgi:putative transposase
LESLLRESIRDRHVLLEQVADRQRLKGLKRLHTRFTAACRDVGLTAKHYPLNQDDQAIRSLSRTVRDWMLSGFANAVRATGGARLKPASALRRAPPLAVREAYDTVEFDAHKLDIRIKILDQDPYGEEQVFEIERIWLLALIDIATRAVLGYCLCLNREYSRHEVIRTLERALAPANRPKLTIPGLECARSGGFVSVVLPETAYTCWRRIRFDNARAHLAADSLDVICDLLGCVVDVGPVYSPDDRPFIERFFATVASHLSHRLPGTTGSNPRDVLRALADPGGNIQLVVGLDELTELLEATVWNYNGGPHSGLGGRTPLEAMRLQVRDRNLVLRQLPEALRRNLCLLQSAHRCRVRGDVARGDKPHITFYHVRYTSARLAGAAHLIGQDLRIYYDADDIRAVRAYLADGTELGELAASGLWRMTPHSVTVRRQVFRAKRLRQIRFGELDNPVEAYLNYRRATAKQSRKAATEIARIKQQINEGKARAVPAAGDLAPNGQPRDLPLVSGPVKAKPLRIPRGFSR